MTEPTLSELQKRVRAFSEARDWGQYHSPRNLAMALTVEAGELLELFLWCADSGPQPLSDRQQEAVAGEAADVLICLLNFCDQAGVDLADAFRAKLAIAEEKYPVDRVRGRALKYNEYPEWQGDRDED